VYKFLNEPLKFLAEWSSFQTQDFYIFYWYYFAILFSLSTKAYGFVNLLKMAFPAYIPDLIAVCEPFIFKTFIKPALQPASKPPGKVNLGIEKYPPEFNALAPYETHCPPYKNFLIWGWVLNFWNYS